MSTKKHDCDDTDAKGSQEIQLRRNENLNEVDNAASIKVPPFWDERPDI